MLAGYDEFKALSIKKNIKMTNHRFDSLLNEFNFLLITSDDNNEEFLLKMNESKVVIVDSYRESDSLYFIICIEKNLIIIDKNYTKSFSNLIPNLIQSNIYFLNNSQEELKQNFHVNFNNFNYDIDENKNLKEEIRAFSSVFTLNRQNKKVIYFWNIIKQCISGYLIKKVIFMKFKMKIQQK